MGIRMTSDGFIEVDVTAEMVTEANRRNDEFFAQCGHSGTYRRDKGRQRITGYLAEMAIREVFPSLKFSESPDVDFVSHNGKTYDSKAQGCNGPPRSHFSATLYENQASRKVDFLIFSRVMNDSSKVWIGGFIEKKKFLEQADYVPAGTPNNNFTYDQSRYVIEYKKLMVPEIEKKL
jgi:hypothetical protein